MNIENYSIPTISRHAQHFQQFICINRKTVTTPSNNDKTFPHRAPVTKINKIRQSLMQDPQPRRGNTSIPKSKNTIRSIHSYNVYRTHTPIKFSDSEGKYERKKIDAIVLYIYIRKTRLKIDVNRFTRRSTNIFFTKSRARPSILVHCNVRPGDGSPAPPHQLVTLRKHTKAFRRGSLRLLRFFFFPSARSFSPRRAMTAVSPAARAIEGCFFFDGFFSYL